MQEQRFVAYMREADERRQAKLAAALAAASPARRQRSREDQEAFYARLLDDTSRRRIKRSAVYYHAREATLLCLDTRQHSGTTGACACATLHAAVPSASRRTPGRAWSAWKGQPLICLA